MKFTVVISQRDLAGMNIYNHLQRIKNPGFRIVLIKEDSINYDKAGSLKSDFLIFATRHQSKSGEKTLSIHFPGNFSKAEYGGKDKELCTAPASLLKQAFIKLNELGQGLEYSISMEATHHGPATKKPVMFIEIGSKQEQWQDNIAGQIIADTIQSTIQDYSDKNYRVAIGFGGMHYCHNFNKIELNTGIAMSHICPKYNIQKIDKGMIKKMMDCSTKKAELALLDWKGLGNKEKQHLIPLLEELNIKWIKTKQVENYLK